MRTIFKLLILLLTAFCFSENAVAQKTARDISGKNQAKISQLSNRGVLLVDGYLFTKVVLKKGRTSKRGALESSKLYAKRNFLLFTLPQVNWKDNVSEASKSLIWRAYTSVSKSEGRVAGQLEVIDRKQDSNSYRFVYAISQEGIHTQALSQENLVSKIKLAIKERKPQLNLLAATEFSLLSPGVFSLKDILSLLVNRYGQGVLWGLTGRPVNNMSYLLWPTSELSIGSDDDPISFLWSKHPFNPVLSLRVAEIFIQNGYNLLANKIIANSLKIYKNSQATPELLALIKKRGVKVKSFFKPELLISSIGDVELEVINSGLSLSSTSEAIIYSLGEAPVKGVAHHVFTNNLPALAQGSSEFNSRYYHLQEALEDGISSKVLYEMGVLLINEGYQMSGLAFIHQSLVLSNDPESRKVFDRYKKDIPIYDGSSV